MSQWAALKNMGICQRLAGQRGDTWLWRWFDELFYSDFQNSTPVIQPTETPKGGEEAREKLAVRPP